MTLLLIVGGWLLAATLTAGLFALLARAGREPEADLPPTPVQLPPDSSDSIKPGRPGLPRPARAQRQKRR